MSDVYVIMRKRDGHVIATRETDAYANADVFKQATFGDTPGGTGGLVAGRVEVSEWAGQVTACATGTCGHKGA